MWCYIWQVNHMRIYSLTIVLSLIGACTAQQKQKSTSSGASHVLVKKENMDTNENTSVSSKEDKTLIDPKIKILKDELKIIEMTNFKLAEESGNLKNEINKLNNKILIKNSEIAAQKDIIKQSDIDKSELEFLRLNLIYSQKCQTRKLFSTGYKVGTPEYKKCILNKGKKINE